MSAAVRRYPPNAFDTLAGGVAQELENRHGALSDACARGDVATALRLLDAGADANGMTMRNSDHLAIAVRRRHLIIVKLLISRGADVNKLILHDTFKPLGRTALYYACSSVVREPAPAPALAQRKAPKKRRRRRRRAPKPPPEPPSAKQKRAYEKIAPYRADFWAHLEAAIEKRKEKRNRQKKKRSKPKPKLASPRGDLEPSHLLLVHGADPNKGGRGEEKPLHLACRLGWLEMCRLLLDYGADVNLEARASGTPLMIVCEHTQQLELVELLLDRGADVNQTRSYSPHLTSPLYLAASQGKTALVWALLRRGADAAPNYLESSPAVPPSIIALSELLEDGPPARVRSRTHWRCRILFHVVGRRAANPGSKRHRLGLDLISHVASFLTIPAKAPSRAHGDSLSVTLAVSQGTSLASTA